MHATNQTAFIKCYTANNTLVALYSNHANGLNQLLQKLLCWTPNMQGGYFWSFGLHGRTILSVHANVTDAVSTMVSTLSSGGGLTSLTTTFLSLKIHTRYPWHFFFFYVTLVS